MLNKVKQYWNNRPCNIKHSAKEVGSKDYFEEVTERKYYVESHIPNFAQFWEWRGKKVLEIGCGIGTDTQQFAENGARIVPVDLSEKSLEIARKRAEFYNLIVNFHHANAEQLSDYIPIDTFDLIYSFGVIHHSPHPEMIIEQIKKYMNKDSTLKIMIYNKISWKVLWILLKYGKGKFWKLNELIAKYSEAQTGCPVTYAYTKRSARKLLKGFEILEMRTEHIFPYSIPEYKNYQYKKVWYFRYLPHCIFRFMERHLGWHLLITARINNG